MSKRSSKQRSQSGVKKYQHQPRTQKRLIQTLFKNAHDAIALIDDRLCFVDMNIAACDLFGVPPQQLKGQALANFITAEFVHQPNSLSFPPGQSLMGELLVSSSAQNQREMEYTLTFNVLPHCHLLLLRDISQRRESMQAELRQQQQRVELFSEVTLKIRQSLQLKEILHTTVTEVQRILQADRVLMVKGFFALNSDISDRKAIERMKDEFISIISHELRTPLTSLHSALKILATARLGSLSTEGQQMLGIADDSTERLVRLVNNVLDLQRIESGKVIMECQACNAANLMIQTAEAMQAMAQQHEISLVKQPQDISVWADADYIMQALTNLLSNFATVTKS